MLRMITFLAVTPFVLFVSSAVAAENICPQRDAIVSFSNIVIAERGHLPNLIARRYGSEAAYLKIRYASLPVQETRDLLQTMLAANVRAADDLAYSWHIHEDGYATTLATLGEKQLDLLVSTMGLSTIRALLLAEGGEEVLMKRVGRAANKPMNNVAGAISTAIIDQPDTIKEKIARAAEAYGLIQIAAYVTATEKDTKRWDAFLTYLSNDEQRKTLTQYLSWLPALVGNPPLKFGKEDYNPVRDEAHQVGMAAAFEPERDFLRTFMNQTGMLEQVHAVTGPLMQQIESGAIKRNGTLDAPWLFAYRGLVYNIGSRTQVDSLLSATAFSGSRYVRPSGIFMIRDVIDRLFAVEALQSYITGKTDKIPPSPLELSDKLKAEWPNWVKIATMIRTGTVNAELARDPASFGIAAELLFAKGDLHELQAYVAQAPLGEVRVSAANDFAMRLDRQCASYLSHPAEAVLLSGQPIFKFDTP